MHGWARAFGTSRRLHADRADCAACGDAFAVNGVGRGMHVRCTSCGADVVIGGVVVRRRRVPRTFARSFAAARPIGRRRSLRAATTCVHVLAVLAGLVFVWWWCEGLERSDRADSTPLVRAR